MRVQTLDGDVAAWIYVLDAYEGGLPRARYLGMLGRRRRGGRRPRRLRRGPAHPSLHLIVGGLVSGAWARQQHRDLEDPRTDPLDVARVAAARLAELTGAERHDVALVLGSGWAPAGELLGETLATVPNTELPGFAAAAVAGHAGTIRSVRIGDSDRRALVFGSRTHLYEGRGVRAVVHGVRTAAAAGCRVIVLTNGCGGLNPAWRRGRPC